MVHGVDFDLLTQQLTPTLRALEGKRKELLKKGRTRGLIWTAIFGVAGVVFLAVSDLLEVFPLIAVAVVALVILIACISSQSKVLSAFYKQEVVCEVVRAFCADATFSPDRGVSQQLFQGCGLFRGPDRYRAEDLIEGCLNKTNFFCSEVHAEERRVRHTKNGVQHYWVDIFKGFFFVADFHKEFQGATTILQNSLFKFQSGESRVKMENPDFEKIFDVFSTNQIEARYLITPSMMERMLKLHRSFKKGITISFRSSLIIVAIPHTQDQFEASIWGSLENMQTLKSDFAVLQSLLGIVDELNLNTRIWSKE